MAWKVYAELLTERRGEMQNSSEGSVAFKRQFKRVLIVVGIVEFIVTVFAVFYVTQK